MSPDYAFSQGVLRWAWHAIIMMPTDTCEHSTHEQHEYSPSSEHALHMRPVPPVLGPIGDTPFNRPRPVLPQVMPLTGVASLAEPGTGHNKAGHWLGLPID